MRSFLYNTRLAEAVEQSILDRFRPNQRLFTPIACHIFEALDCCLRFLGIVHMTVSRRERHTSFRKIRFTTECFVRIFNGLLQL